MGEGVGDAGQTGGVGATINPDFPFHGSDISSDADDPVMHAIVDRKGLDRMAVSSSQMGRFDTEWLTTDSNLAALSDLSGVWIDRVHDRRPPKLIILDMDSSESPTYGNQEGSAYPQRDRDLGLGLAFVTKQSLADRCRRSAPAGASRGQGGGNQGV